MGVLIQLGKRPTTFRKTQLWIIPKYVENISNVYPNISKTYKDIPRYKNTKQCRAPRGRAGRGGATAAAAAAVAVAAAWYFVYFGTYL